MFKQYQRYKLFLMGADVLVSILVLAIVVEMRPQLPGKFMELDSGLPSIYLYGIIGLLWHVVFAFKGVYELDRITHVSEYLDDFTFTHSVAVLMLGGLLFFSFRETSRLLVIYFGIANYVALLLLRYALVSYLGFRRRRGQGLPVLIVGTLDNALRVARLIEEDRHSLLMVAGFSDTRQPADVQFPGPFLGTVDGIDEIVRSIGIRVIVIAPSDVPAAGVAPLNIHMIMHQLEQLPVRVYKAPDLETAALVNSNVQRFGNLLLVGLRDPVVRGPQRTRKRILDLTICLFVLFLGWPIFVIIWLLVRLDSKGPGIISVKRVGENGKIFEMYKFRTMVDGSEDIRDRVVMEDKNGQKVYKLRDDPRVTRVGRWLRKYSLDELPQVINVLKGEMSCVGPRPEQPFITESYDHWQWQRASVLPGITGWWQIEGRADLPMHLNTEKDIYYVQNYSIVLDLKIILRTVVAVIKARGAF